MSWLSQLDNVAFVTVCFCIFTAALTLFVLVWSCFKKSSALIMFNKRMATLWVLILLFALALGGGKLTSCLFFAALSAVGLAEYQTMVGRMRQDNFHNPLIYVFWAAQYAALYFDVRVVFVALIPFALFFLIPFFGIVYRQRQDIWQICLSDYVGLMLTVYAMSYMFAYIAFEQMQAQNGVALLLFILILTLMSDFFQAICGFLCGRHYVAPLLSPHKTWEGLIGGGFLTAGLAYILGKYLTPFSLSELLIGGFVLNIAAFCGDVTISAIKRYAGVKDSSRLLPGHGGLLDRFDSILLTAPLLFWYVIWYY